ncbi:hypothetical protein ATANTOWER_017177 [Ataeniobius toweri]|uniref:Uncharacterized protein n=1 Tax=Ataeniobius toweri TaxID=208326 RepID=A0ABU7BT29_9TELE|nr:hypothetical protein [Ataeniobius toweri]
MTSDLSHTLSFRAEPKILSALQRTKPPSTSKTSRLLDQTHIPGPKLHSLQGEADPVPESSCHNRISLLHKIKTLKRSDVSSFCMWVKRIEKTMTPLPLSHSALCHLNNF